MSSETTIDKWDVALFKRFLKLAQREGTNRIKVIVGDKPETWVVSLHDAAKEKPERPFVMVPCYCILCEGEHLAGRPGVMEKKYLD